MDNCIGTRRDFLDHTGSWIGGFSKLFTDGDQIWQSFFQLKKVYRMLGSMGINISFARLFVDKSLKSFN